MPRRLDKLLLHAQRTSLCPPNLLDQISKQRPGGDNSISYSLFSSRPLENAWRCRGVVVVSLFVILPLTCIELSRAVHAWSAGSIPPFQHYRFTSLEQRDGSVASESPGIQSFGLMRRGEMEGKGVSVQGKEGQCVASDAGAGRLTADGASMTLSLASKPDKKYTMWYVRTLEEAGTEGKDAVRFMLEGSDDLEAWQTVGSSSSVGFFTSVVFTHGVAETPERRGSNLLLDARLSVWHWTAFSFVHVTQSLSFTLISGYSFFAVSAAELGTKVLIGSFGFFGFARICIGLVMLVLSTSPEIPNGIYSIGFGANFCVLGLWYFNRKMAAEGPLIACGVYLLFLHMYLRMALFDSTEAHIEDTPASLLKQVFWLFIGLFIFALRVTVMLQVHKGIALAKAAYLKVWQRVCGEQRADVIKLGQTVAKVRSSCEPRKAQQLGHRGYTEAIAESKQTQTKPSRVRPAAGVPPASPQSAQSAASPTESPRYLDARTASDDRLPQRLWRSSVSTQSIKTVFGVVQGRRPDPSSSFSENVVQSNRFSSALMHWQQERLTPWHLGRPVEKLDQLYTQAYLVQDTFLDYVVELAREHNGKFRLAQPQGDVLFDAWDGAEESRGRYVLGGIKSVWRATTKLQMAYQGDVSRLCDIVRETLYFETLAELEVCLGSMVKDSMVDIVSVKSTMQAAGEFDSVQADSNVWARMPFVSVKVRLAGSHDARGLCCDAHVCELLLMLTDIGSVQTAEMGVAFRNWRNCMVSISFFCHMVKRVAGKRLLPASHQPRGGASEAETPSSGAPVSAEGGNASPGDAVVPFPGPSGDVQDGGVGSGSLMSPPDAESAESAESAGWTGRWVATSGVRRELSRPDSLREVAKADSMAAATASRELSRADSLMAVRTPLSDVGNADGRRWEGGEASWGMRVDAEMEELLEGLCRLSALGVADFLDKRWKSLVRGESEHGFQSSSLSGLFYAMHPITAASSRKPTQVFLLGLGSYVLAQGIVGAMNFQFRTRQDAFGPYRHYRLETLLTRNGSVGRGVTGPGVSEFGLMDSLGCSRYAALPLEAGEAADRLASFSGPVGSSFLTTFAHPQGVNMTGWYIRTGASDGSEDLDPAYFNVWATNDEVHIGNGSCADGREEERWWKGKDAATWCGAEWRRVGAPTWRFRAFSSASDERNDSGWWDFLQLKISLPLARSSLETFLLKPPYNLYNWFWATPQLLMGPAVLLTGLSSYLRPFIPFYPPPHISLPFGIGCASFFSGVSGMTNGVAGVNHIMFESLAVFVSMSFLTVAFARQGPSFIYAVWLYVVIQIGSWVFLCHMFWHNPFQRMTFTGLLGMLLAVVVTGLRIYQKGASKKLLMQDQKVYDELYKKLVESEDGSACLAHLENVVRMVGLGNDTEAHCRQFNRARADRFTRVLRDEYLAQTKAHPVATFPLFWDIGHWYVPGRPDRKSQVSSVNQLYASSAIANLLLVERVKTWAESCSGMVRIGPSADGATRQPARDSFVKWSDVRDDPSLNSRLKETAMKRHNRALEKLLRSYGNVPSLLLDISRNSLVFTNLSDLTMCLGMIVTDESVRVERLKNRMSPRHNSDDTGGYRDVFINLRVVNEQAHTLGAELTMCEVQLLLEDFALLKTAEGHKRYVKARNGMGN